MSNRAKGSTMNSHSWAKKALVGFLGLVLLIYGLIFFTGSHNPTPKLGIDLQGGTRVTLVPQGDKPSSEQLSQARSILEQRVNGMGVSGAEVITDGDSLVITVPGEDSSQARTLGTTSQLTFRTLRNPGQPTAEIKTVAVDVANRWVEAGIITPDQANESLNTLLTALKGQNVPDLPEEWKVTAAAPQPPANSLEEKEYRDKQVSVLKADRQTTDPNVLLSVSSIMRCEGADPLAGADDLDKPLISCYTQSGQNGGKEESVTAPIALDAAPILVGEEGKENPRRLTGESIDSSSQVTGGINPQTGQAEISFKFKTGSSNPGGETWQKLGTDFMGQQVAILLDSAVISAPVFQSATPAGQNTQITGSFTDQEARDLANNLRYGALPLSFVGENGEKGGTAQTISPTLGFASLQAGLIAGAIGLLLVSIYALIYYRGLGLVAILSLGASAVLVYGALVLLGRWIGYSLDLAGIAGLIIGIGTTADSFIVYFERIKDEIRLGHSFRSAVPRGWNRAKSTIITGNLVSLIAAVVLYILAIGDVKGFAFTLGLTTVFDVIVAFLVTAPLMILLSRRPFWARASWNGLGSALKSGHINAQINAQRKAEEKERARQLAAQVELEQEAPEPPIEEPEDHENPDQRNEGTHV